MNEKMVFDKAVNRLVEEDPRYRREAYLLVFDGLGCALVRLGERRHLTAAELVDGVLEFAVREYGPLASAVLADWGVHGPVDIGRIVYKLIDAGLLAASSDDSPVVFLRVTKGFHGEARAAPPAPGSIPKID